MEDKKREIQQSLVSHILAAAGVSSKGERQEAFNNRVSNGPLKELVRRIALTPSRITDEEIAAVRDSGFSEDQIFELVICAAVGQAGRQYNSALEALSKALADLKGIHRET